MCGDDKPRRHTACSFVIGVLITVAFMYVAYGEQNLTSKLPSAGIGLLGVIVAAIGGRGLLKPRTLFDVTDRGVVMYMESGAVTLTDPFFIPWNKIESIDYEVRKGVFDANGNGPFTIKTLALKVYTDSAWSPVGKLKRNYEADRNVVHLDAATGTPHGENLVEQVQNVFKRYKRHAP